MAKSNLLAFVCQAPDKCRLLRFLCKHLQVSQQLQDSLCIVRVVTSDVSALLQGLHVTTTDDCHPIV